MRSAHWHTSSGAKAAFLSHDPSPDAPGSSPWPIALTGLPAWYGSLDFLFLNPANELRTWDDTTGPGAWARARTEPNPRLRRRALQAQAPPCHSSHLPTSRRRWLIVVLGDADTRVLPVRVPEGDLKPCGLSASNASGAAPCRSARHTCDAAGRPRPPDPCIRLIQRDRNDSRLREMQRQRDSAKHHAANERCSDDC